MQHPAPAPVSLREINSIDRGGELLSRVAKLTTPPTAALRQDALRASTALTKLATRLRASREG